MADWKKLVLRPLVVGSAVVLVTPVVNDLLVKWVTFMAPTNVGGLGFPHGFLAAGLVFLTVDTLIQKVNALSALR